MSDECEYKIFTIGVYGFTEERFFDALKSAGIDLLCDIRRRRGLRGSKYRFANSKYLQQRLKECGIGYHHAIELAPSNEVRSKQWEADKASGVTKTERTSLGSEFVSLYSQNYLKDFDPVQFLKSLGNSRSICFICVETEPDCCHRSLVAEKIALEMKLQIGNLAP